MTKKISTVILTVLVAAALAGCKGGSASPTASASANHGQLLALGQQWVQCLRGHGLTRMPDAQLSQDGYLQFPPVSGYNWKEDLGKHRSIIDRPFLGRVCSAMTDVFELAYVGQFFAVGVK